MLLRDVILWEVDTQADFMLPGGKLYVPGAEKLLPNIRRLTDAARIRKARVAWMFSHERRSRIQNVPPSLRSRHAGSKFRS